MFEGLDDFLVGCGGWAGGGTGLILVLVLVLSGFVSTADFAHWFWMWGLVCDLTQ